MTILHFEAIFVSRFLNSSIPSCELLAQSPPVIFCLLRACGVKSRFKNISRQYFPMTERRVAKPTGSEQCSRPVLSSYIAFPLLSTKLPVCNSDAAYFHFFIWAWNWKVGSKNWSVRLLLSCRTFFGRRGTSSWYVVLFSYFCRETCFRLRRPTFHRFF